MSEVHIEVLSPFQQNTSIISDRNGDCVIIDPGCYNAAEEEVLKAYIRSKNLNPIRLLNTHCHIDHVFGNAFVHEQYGLLPEIHEEDLPTLTVMTPGASRMYGVNYKPSPLPKTYLKAGDRIEFGATKLDVLFTPGHAPGHVVFVNHEERYVINGDVLFYGSIGRTDLPGCNHEKLIESIHTRLMVLPDDYKVYCGHGPQTTIGFERNNNPFLH